MFISIPELKGNALSYAVATARGWVNYPADSVERGSVWHCDPDKAPFGEVVCLSSYHPWMDPIAAYDLQEMASIGTMLAKPSDPSQGWLAYRCGVPLRQTGIQEGPNVLVAICRCYVAIQTGSHSVLIPDNYERWFR